jgi:hypothetical protein
MGGQIDKCAVDAHRDLINTIGKLEPTIFHMNRRILMGRVSTVDIG